MTGTQRISRDGFRDNMQEAARLRRMARKALKESDDWRDASALYAGMHALRRSARGWRETM